MNDPKTTPAFPRAGTPAQYADGAQDGLSQYAYVAMTFHAALIGRGWQAIDCDKAFDHAGAFFAELAKRTQS